MLCNGVLACMRAPVLQNMHSRAGEHTFFIIEYATNLGTAGCQPREYIYIYIYIYFYMCTHIHIYIYIYIIYIYIYICVHVYIHIYTYIHVYTYTNIHTHTHIYIYIYIYTCLLITSCQHIAHYIIVLGARRRALRRVRRRGGAVL